MRHGMVEGEKRLLGHTDAPLSDAGRNGVRRVAKRLEETAIDALYSSDLARTMETASIINEGRGLLATALPAFRELFMGEWDGLEAAEVMSSNPERIREWWSDPSRFRTPNGESLQDLRLRVVPELLRVVASHQGQTVCLVAHGGVNRVILFEAMGLSLKSYYTVSQEYACVNRIRYFSDGAVVVDLVNG